MPRYSKLWYWVGVLFIAAIAVRVVLNQTGPKSYATLSVFNVGQGDSIYFRTPQGNDVLIDGGPSDAVLAKLGKVMPFFDRTIELVVLTHPQADHATGLVEVLKRYRVENLLLSEVTGEKLPAAYEQLRKLAKEKNIAIVLPHLGQRIFLDDFTVLDIYYPFEQSAASPKDLNDLSLVGRISYGKMNVILTADADQTIEKLLLHLNLPVDAEVLKVGHHGSKNSSSLEFLAKVQPENSVISVGKNSYGHPNEEVLGAIGRQGSKIFRTDQDDDVVFQIYPDTVVLQPPK